MPNRCARASFHLSEAAWRGSGQAGGVGVLSIAPELFDQQQVHELDGLLLDSLDLECSHYTPAPELLAADHDEAPVTETLVSHLLKSNCLVTGQPYWASVQISYSGAQLDQAGLLQYLVSFRNHNEFHEQCVEAHLHGHLDALPPHQAVRVRALYAPRRAGHQPAAHQPPAAAAASERAHRLCGIRRQEYSRRGVLLRAA